MYNILIMENDNIVMQGLKNQADGDQKIQIARKNQIFNQQSFNGSQEARLIPKNMTTDIFDSKQ